MSSDTGGDPNAFLADYKSEGGWYNEALFGLARYPGMGLGGQALQDIDSDTPVFHTPLKYLLTPYTSDLRSKISAEQWEGLEGGWSRLILVMMYETEQGDKSPWCKYMRSLPTKFTSPMQWTEEERGYLKGTTVSSREEAEESFREVLEPVIKANPELFPPTSTNFDLTAFHLQGSRILSRSFTIPRRRADPEIWDQAQDVNEDEDSEEDDEEEEGEAVMIPMADMLNAGFEMGNVHLFGDGDEDNEANEKALEEQGPGYTMSTTRAIAKGEQIFNDYGEPANWELLRRFGHVDTVELPEEILEKMTEEEIGGYKLGNPGDEVVFDLQDVVNAAHIVTGKTLEKLETRAEWWSENGEEDTFRFSFEDDVEEPLVAFARLLIYDFEWSRARKTGEAPAASLDTKSGKVIEQIITSREADYTGDLQSDLKIIKEAESLRNPHTMAAIVRLGERRVLGVTRRMLQAELQEAEEEEKKAEKRKAEKGDKGQTRQVKKGKMKLS